MSKSEIVVEHPQSLEEAMNIKQQSEGNFIAGGTLTQISWEAGLPYSPTLINLETIQALRGIEYIEQHDRTFIRIGALTTIAECIENHMIIEHTPLLFEACKNIAAPAVRNRATLGGNVASGIGDSIPALLALDADVTIRIKDKTEQIKLWEWFQIQREFPQSTFLLLDIIIPCQRNRFQSFYKKVGRREAFTPALVTVSAYWKNGTNGELAFIRLAVGGGDHHPCRLLIAEKIVETNFHNEKLFKSLYPDIIDEITSYSDPFFSDTYRKRVAANLLVAELMEIFLKREARRDEIKQR